MRSTPQAPWVPVLMSLLIAGAVSCAKGDKGDCGDGKLQAGEECDATSLAGKTCEILGHEAGELACTRSCTFDLSDCGPCANPCTTEGATRCNAGRVETCLQGPVDCTNWEITADCEVSGQDCDSTSGTAMCVAR